MPIGFAGGLRDWTTGFVRFGARDYDPRTARFTTPDPSLFSGSPLNLYDYAAGDPISNVDPSGLACVGAGLGAVAYFGSSFCQDSEGKSSLCLEFGVGVGGGVDYDVNGSVADDFLTVNAEGSAKLGIIGATVGAELNMDCDTVKTSAKVGGGPVTLAAYDENGLRFAGPGQNNDIAQGSLGNLKEDWESFRNFKFGLEGKLTGKWCWNNK